MDHSSLSKEGSRLACEEGHQYWIVDSIPVMLAPGLEPTHPYLAETLEAVARGESTCPLPSAPGGAVDPFVQEEIVKTGGHLYDPLKGRLVRYPIPRLRLPPGEQTWLLDVGCNWGRWTLAAARSGYRAVGIEPSLEACRAARRVARQLGLDAAFVAGDARRLPFRTGSYAVAFSYSVLQHFAKEDARAALAEMARILEPGGTALVQMPNLFGVRQLFNRARQILRRESGIFRVRYWTPRELNRTFEELIGPSERFVDGFFSLNPQANDLDLLTPGRRAVVRTSETLRKMSDHLPALGLIADSLYMRSTRAMGKKGG